MARRYVLDQHPGEGQPGRGEGQSFPFPAPVEGLNLADARSAIRPTEARELVNWLPDRGVLTIRDGHDEHGTGVGSGKVPTLVRFDSAGTSQLIAVSGGKIWDVSSAGAASEIYDGSFNSDRFQTELFNGYLFGVNGTDTPWRYNGSAHSATGFTGSGLTLSNLVNIQLVRNRLWCAENNSLDAWYAGAGSITGTLTKFQLSQIARGGYLMGVWSWSRDMGDGADDLTVFITSIGDVVVYQGDPASTFSLIGKFSTAEPIGRQCAFNVGGELVVITRAGAFPVSAIMDGLPQDGVQVRTWGKVAPGLTRDEVLYGSNAEWFGLYAKGLAYINVPKTVSTSAQYVLNTRNSRWTTFDFPAAAMAEFDGSLYFGGLDGGVVYKVTGTADNGADIIATARSGFDYIGGSDISKRVTAVRPNVVADSLVQGIFAIDTDFVTKPFSGPLHDIVPVGSGTVWGDPWGSPWSDAANLNRRFISTKGRGRALGIGLRVQTQASNVFWDSSDVFGKVEGRR